MPPRRSTRASTRASVEPAVLEPATTSKRKRTQPAEEEVHTEEKENVGKPQSRSRRESARQTPSARSKGRTSSRSKATLQDVAESDEEEQVAEDPPLVKRARPSPDEDDGDVESEGPIPAVKGRKPASRSRRADRNVANDEHDMQVDNANTSEDNKPATRRRTGSSANRKSVAPPSKRPSVARTSKTARALSKAAHTKSEEDQDASDHSEKEDLLRPTSVEPKPEPGLSQSPDNVPFPSSSKATTSDDPSAIDRKPSTSKVKAEASKDRLRARHSTTEAVNTTDNASTDDSNEAPLDAPPLSQRLSQAAPVAAEPEGPKARLVIHKMVLINFKSYAGRQDIGPFHKVSPI